MQRYLVGRILMSAVSLLVLSFVVFIMARLSGDPLDLMLPLDASKVDHARMAAHLGLDKPLLVQYGIFLSHAVRGDFGESLRVGSPALGLVLERLPATLELGATAIVISVVLALPIGVYSAVRRGKPLDFIGRGVAVLGQSLPLFWLGLVLILVFSVWLRVLPSGGRDGPQSLILPAVTIGWYTVAGIMRLTRSSMLDVLTSEYIKLARIKGLPETVIIWKHALKNAALPILTFAVVLFVTVLAGSVVTETVFAWPGIGRLAMDSIQWRDFPVVQTVVLLLGVMYIGANLLVDILYGYLDPKIRHQR